MLSAWLGSDKYQILSHWFHLTSVQTHEFEALISQNGIWMLNSFGRPIRLPTCDSSHCWLYCSGKSGLTLLGYVECANSFTLTQLSRQQHSRTRLSFWNQNWLFTLDSKCCLPAYSGQHYSSDKTGVLSSEGQLNERKAVCIVHLKVVYT